MPKLLNNESLVLKRLIFLAKNILFLAIGVLILFLVFKDKDLTVIKEKIYNINYVWVIAGMTIGVLSNYVRGVRWGLLLEPLGHHPSKTNLFCAMMIMNFSNLLVLRSGELMRCWVLKKTDSVPVGVSLGSVVVGRATDFVMLFLVAFLAYIINYETVTDFFYENIFLSLKSKLAGVNLFPILGLLGIGLILLIGLFFKGKSLFKKFYNFTEKIWEEYCQ